MEPKTTSKMGIGKKMKIYMTLMRQHTAQLQGQQTTELLHWNCATRLETSRLWVQHSGKCVLKGFLKYILLKVLPEILNKNCEGAAPCKS